MKFELKNLTRNCSDKEIIDEIKRVDVIVGKELLTRKDYDEHGKITSGTIQKRLGGWQKALNVAKLGHKYSGRTVSEKMRKQNKNLTDKEILKELRTAAEKLDKNYISQEEIKDNSEMISASTVIYRFGSWSKGLKKAGLQLSPYGKRFTENEYYENLLNVWTHCGRQPFLREMAEHPSAITPSAYESRFGSWRKALEAFINKMDKKDDELEQKEITSVVKEPEEEIKKISVPSEDRHEIKLGLRYKILSRDKFKCIKCGTSPATDPKCKLHIDHIIPFSKGGKTILDNLQTLCEKCNLGKGNRHSK